MTGAFDVQLATLRALTRQLRSRGVTLSEQSSLGAAPDAGVSTGEVGRVLAAFEDGMQALAQAVGAAADKVDRSAQAYQEADDGVGRRLGEIPLGPVP